MKNFLDFLTYLIVFLAMTWALWKGVRFFLGKKTGCSSCHNEGCSFNIGERN